MEMSLIHRLRDWIATLDGSKKMNFRSFSLNALFPLSRTLFFFPFLYATIRYWNSVTHVFHFESQEMCPTLKEVQALMESRCGKAIMPQPRFGNAQDLGQKCRLSVQEARCLAYDGELDIPGLVHRFSLLEIGVTFFGAAIDNMLSVYAYLHNSQLPLVMAEPVSGWSKWPNAWKKVRVVLVWHWPKPWWAWMLFISGKPPGLQGVRYFSMYDFPPFWFMILKSLNT